MQPNLGVCSTCSSLRDEEYARQKFGWPEHDTCLPEAATRLKLVRDLSPYGSRKLQLLQCPECLAWYLYRTDYEYLVNGSEDEEFLTRLSEQEAAAYLQPPV